MFKQICIHQDNLGSKGNKGKNELTGFSVTLYMKILDKKTCDNYSESIRFLLFGFFKKELVIEDQLLKIIKRFSYLILFLVRDTNRKKKSHLIILVN